MRVDPLKQAQQTGEAQRTRAAQRTGDSRFADALRDAAGTQSAAAAPALEFSKHALERLEQRGIRLSDELMERLSGAVARAEAKGSKTTLVLIDDTAFVVGVPANTVVTVADQASLREKVFTNIDSMVIA